MRFRAFPRLAILVLLAVPTSPACSQTHALQGGAAAEQGGRKSWAHLVVVAVPPRVMSIVVLASDPQVLLNNYASSLEAFLGGRRFAVAPEPRPSANNTTRPATPAPAGGATRSATQPPPTGSPARPDERAGQAGSIVYIDANHDIWMTGPDGATKRRITNDGSAQHYVSPSEADDGTIVASGKQAFFHYFNQDGSKARGPFVVLGIPCPSIDPPLTSQVNAQGTMAVYDYLDAPGCLKARGTRVAFATTSSVTGAGVYGQFWGQNPRWVPGTNYAAYVSPQGSQIITTDNPKQNGTVWITEDKTYLRSFDISRIGTRVLIAKAASSTDFKSRSHLILWQNNGTPPAKGSAVCAVLNWGENDDGGHSMPRWSPDGTQFTWADSEGVWVSPAPVPGTGGECVIHPKLIVPGGKSPDWGLPNVGTSRRGTGQH